MRPLGSAWRCLATVLVVVGVLAGCTVGPNYKRPEVIVPADWRNSPERGDSLGDLGWWELFKDPALYELIATAVVTNRDLQVAVARVLESRAQLGVARAAQFPQVNAGASYQYTRPFSENSPVLNGSPRGPFTGTTSRPASTSPLSWTCGGGCDGPPRRPARSCWQARRTDASSS